MLLVREEGDGATFSAPYEGPDAMLAIGVQVALAVKVWNIENGKTFTAAVARPMHITEAAGRRTATGET